MQWREYEKTGDTDILNSLLLYNYEDIVNLEKLMYLLSNEPAAPVPPPFKPRSQEPLGLSSNSGEDLS